MICCKVGFWRVRGAGAGFGGKLVQADMEEVEIATFVGREVVKPRMIRWMRSRGEGGFEGLEVKGGKINGCVQVRDAGMEKAVGVVLDSRRSRKLGVGKRGRWWFDDR